MLGFITVILQEQATQQQGWNKIDMVYRKIESALGVKTKKPHLNKQMRLAEKPVFFKTGSERH
jgi:hypothetical protein